MASGSPMVASTAAALPLTCNLLWQRMNRTQRILAGACTARRIPWPCCRTAYYYGRMVSSGSPSLIPLRRSGLFEFQEPNATQEAAPAIGGRRFCVTDGRSTDRDCQNKPSRRHSQVYGSLHLLLLPSLLANRRAPVHFLRSGALGHLRHQVFQIIPASHPGEGFDDNSTGLR